MEQAQTKDFSIIMPCYNRAHDLQKVLEAYDQQMTDASFELIAVDDCSKDKTFEILSTYKPLHYALKVERMEKNSGPAAARNRGIPCAEAPLVAFVGDDILPDPYFVQGHIEAHNRFPEQGIAILGKIHWPEDSPRNTLMNHIDGIGAQQFSYHYMVEGQEYDFRHFYTANISLKTEFLRSLPKWFDTSFVFAAFEDVELSYRLSKRGLKIIYQSSIDVAHYHYHNIWTFSDRQYKSGLMALVLVGKHPVLNRWFRAPVKQLLGLVLFHPLVLTKRWTPEDAAFVEMFVKRIANHYEWENHALLDLLYLKVLEYFYFLGILDGVFEKTFLKTKARTLYCMRFLLPDLIDYIDASKRSGIPLPDFVTEGDFQRLTALAK